MASQLFQRGHNYHRLVTTAIMWFSQQQLWPPSGRRLPQSKAIQRGSLKFVSGIAAKNYRASHLPPHLVPGSGSPVDVFVSEFVVPPYSGERLNPRATSCHFGQPPSASRQNSLPRGHPETSVKSYTSHTVCAGNRAGLLIKTLSRVA